MQDWKKELGRLTQSLDIVDIRGVPYRDKDGNFQHTAPEPLIQFIEMLLIEQKDGSFDVCSYCKLPVIPWACGCE